MSGEASAEERIGQPLSREDKIVPSARVFRIPEGNMDGRASAKRLSGSAWSKTLDVFDQVVRAVNLILEAFRPEGDRRPHNPALDPPINMDPNAEFFQVGEQLAEAALLTVLNPRSVAAKFTRLGERLGENFDPVTVDRITKNLKRLRRAKSIDKAASEG